MRPIFENHYLRVLVLYAAPLGKSSHSMGGTARTEAVGETGLPTLLGWAPFPAMTSSLGELDIPGAGQGRRLTCSLRDAANTASNHRSNTLKGNLRLLFSCR